MRAASSTPPSVSGRTFAVHRKKQGVVQKYPHSMTLAVARQHLRKEGDDVSPFFDVDLLTRCKLVGVENLQTV